MTSMEKEFYLDFDGTVGIPRCNPAEVIEKDGRTILKFSCGRINLPKLSFLGIPELDNDYAELLSNDGAVVRVTCGEFEQSNYNSGDPLPARFNVASVVVNGEDVTWKHIDPWYPWVKYDIESIAFKLYEIYQEEQHGGLLHG